MPETQTENSLILLIQRVSEMQLEQGRALQSHAKAQHEISTALAVLNTRLEPLVNLTADIHALNLKVVANTARLDQHHAAIGLVSQDVDGLKTVSNSRRGLEGPLGKVAMLVLGSVITVCAAMLIPKVSAEEKAPFKRPVFEHPCWAVPAEHNKHQWLWL